MADIESIVVEGDRFAIALEISNHATLKDPRMSEDRT